MPLNNTTGALWLTITNLAVLSNGTNTDIATNTSAKSCCPNLPSRLPMIWTATSSATACGPTTGTPKTA